ncbi:alpha/beta fold hydrolase [Leucobacter sp. UCMA 4100]|uniref:alpha/beta fold hydrolase n=1 Tax=Leucobacter sp. UCMA 4100 TaxID=2810534 RepID=UPI0022EABAF0|nr:alpha/beta fold hydrolase [Leucobacter sp. UCMA 4100]MDA3148047.1 alpha/beta fold hydrolase [Leucobacter sp. UCMA 4100]
MTNWYRVGRDMLARDIWTEVPLDWSEPEGEQIRIFAREFADPARLQAGLDDVPAIVYLQGGPGGKGARPLARDPFLTAALKRFRVVLPDQRGTGRSTPALGSEYAKLDAETAAKRLSLMRADSIVQDFEALRKEHFGGKPWWTMGQSYGGFLTLHYLSVAPEAVVASAITGGLPSIDADPDEVYRRTFPRTLAKNEQFFARFPHLQARVDRIADLLERDEVLMPGGDRLTVERFQTLGQSFGVEIGFDRVHWLLDEAFADEAETVLSETFVNEVFIATGYASNPLYMVLQESIYGAGPTNWSAERERGLHPEFNPAARPLRFTGEMTFPWMAEQFAELRPFAEGWRLLASRAWPIELYDHERLAANEVPIEAAVYYDDMFVDAQLSLDTASRVKNLHAWVTNEYEHDGVRMGDVVERLFTALEMRIASRGL